MSYTFLQEQGEESSAECFSDIPASVLSRLSPTAGAFSCNASETESYQGSQSGTMFAPSTDAHGAAMSTASAEAIRAREIAMLHETVVRLRAWETSFCGSSAKYFRQALSAKTPALSDGMLPGLLESSEKPWRDLVIEPSWSSWGHVVWGLPTAKCDHGSLRFRSPNARDWKGMSAKSWRERTKGDTTPTLPDQIGGVPHPEFVEELMLWPIGWTDLKPLETDKFQQWLHSHGAYLENQSADLTPDRG